VLWLLSSVFCRLSSGSVPWLAEDPKRDSSRLGRAPTDERLPVGTRTGFRYWLIRSERNGVLHRAHWTQSAGVPSAAFGLGADAMRMIS
jgi:hypothetical protein